MTALTLAQCTARTIRMLRHFLHLQPKAKILLKDNLRKDWDMSTDDFEILEQWIEGAISPSQPGFFQDVRADVSRADLVNSKKAGTVELLVTLIWTGIPDDNKA